jgi:hypothetical protein
MGIRHRLGWFDVKNTASDRCLDPVEVASPSPWASIHEIGFLCTCHVNWGRQLEGHDHNAYPRALHSTAQPEEWD